MRMTKINEPITISIVGAGNRARCYIDALNKYNKGKFKIVALFEPNFQNAEYFIRNFSVDKSQVYNGGIDDFIKLDRISDVVMIATLDDSHYVPCIHAIKKGYDIILEKPISMSLEETLEIGKLASLHKDQHIVVCHVLRYAPFYRTIKEIIDSGRLGKVVDIQYNENIGYYHFAHSYVRGNWRNTDVAAPIIVAKSCHDMDMLLYFLNSSCIKLSAFGSLNFFTHDKYDDKKMAPRCSKCKIESNCPYSAIKIYGEGKIRSVVFNRDTEESLIKDLETSPYGRCVFNCDNNVCDNMELLLEFENGVHATFNMSAFSNKIHRSLKIMCEYGEIRGLEYLKEIEVAPFGKEVEIVPVINNYTGGHNGADEGFMVDFMNAYLNNLPMPSSIDKSIESHVMAYLAEKSRINNGDSILIKEYINNYIKEEK